MLAVKNSRGYTFIEIMVTLVILAVGIGGIYKAFLVTLDQMSHLTNRLYANNVLDNRLHEIDRMLKAYKTLPYELSRPEVIDAGYKQLSFTQQMNIKEVGTFNNIFEIDIKVSWKERGREFSLIRSAYISDYEME